MKRILFTLVIILLLGLAAAAALVAYSYSEQRAPGPLTEDRIVLIRPGTGFKGVAELLAREGVIAQKELFMLPAILEKQHRLVKAGEYVFPAGASGEAVLAKLIKGDVLVHALTIPEGLTVTQVIALVRGEEALTGDVPEGLGEGVLLPETYHFIRGDTREGLIAKMSLAQETALRDAWATRAEDLPVRSPEEALILASIVERETGIADERGMVAGVYTNRLRIGMMLQADPTVAYGVMLAEGRARERPLTRKDLQADTAYNTYTRTGLPPTPIACPGKASIRAVLQPTDTDALYFVATGTGGHRFARTLDEHNRNVRDYRAVLRSQKQR